MVRLSKEKIFEGNSKIIILLADEITPDTCKLWDLQSNCKLGYERACAELDNAIMFYKEIIKRFNLDEYSIE